jgi:hypothetical protein
MERSEANMEVEKNEQKKILCTKYSAIDIYFCALISTMGDFLKMIPAKAGLKVK